MIYDEIKNGTKYKGITEELDIALEFLRKIAPSGAEPGQYALEKGVRYTVMDCDLADAAGTKWECHRKYIDIQWALAEGEVIGVSPVSRIRGWGSYTEERDVCFASDSSEGIILPMNKKVFAVFFPEDAHRPCQAAGENRRVRKIVIKIPVSCGGTSGR